jgi:hypothetical protein
MNDCPSSGSGMAHDGLPSASQTNDGFGSTRIEGRAMLVLGLAMNVAAALWWRSRAGWLS